jgi:hypothetical protein
VPGLIAASAGSDWTYGGSILTFVFPMILFLAVAAVLYVLYTKPQVVPGNEDIAHERSVASTPVAKMPSEAGPPAGPGVAAGGGQTAAAHSGQAATAATGQAGSADGAEGKA